MPDSLTQKPKKSVFKKIVSFLANLLFVALFFMIGPFSIFLIFIIVFFIIIFKDKSNFLKYQEILPTAKIRSMAMGLVEIQGKTIATDTFIAPINSKQCIGYKYTIEKINRNKDGKKSYSTIHTENKCHRFFIEDDSGKVEVNPEKLELVMFPIDKQYSSGSKRYTQYILLEDSEVLLIGKACLEDGKPIIAYEEIKDVFGIAPASDVTHWNRLKPLRMSIAIHISAFAILLSIILLASIKEVDGFIIITLPETIFSWNLFN